MRCLVLLSVVGCLTDPAQYGAGGAGTGGAPVPLGGGGAGAGAAGGAGGGGTHDDHVVWVQTEGGEQDQSFEAVAIGSEDEIYVGGRWDGHFDMPVLGGVCAVSGARVAFIQARDGNGERRWTRCFGEDASIVAMAADASGTVVAVGTFSGHIDVGDGGTPSAGGTDVFVVALSSEGEVIWGTTFGSTKDDTGQGLALGAQGTVFVSGSFRGPMNIGTHPLPAPESVDLYFTKIVQGSPVWAKESTTAGGAPTMQLAIRQDAPGPLVAAGTFQGWIDPDGAGPTEPVDAADAEPDGYAFTFDVNGDIDAVVPLVAPFAQSISNVRASGAMAVLAGTFEGTIEYDPANPLTAGSSDAFSLSMTFEGAVEGVAAIGGSGAQRGLDASFDLVEGAPVVLGGAFSGATMLGDETLNAADDAEDGFVAYYAAGIGAPLAFATRIGGDGVQSVHATALLEGEILVVGAFSDTLVLEGPHPSAGGRDAFIARIRP